MRTRRRYIPCELWLEKQEATFQLNQPKQNTIPGRKRHLVNALSVKGKFWALLRWVEAGDEVVITRRGRAVARLVSANVGHDRAGARRAADALLAATRGWRLDGVKVKSLHADGRRQAWIWIARHRGVMLRKTARVAGVEVL